MTTNTIDFRVESVAKNGKYIIAQQDSQLVFYAMEWPNRESFYHYEIAQHYRVHDDTIVGGGRINVTGRRLQLSGESTDYGAVTIDMLQKFAPHLVAFYNGHESESVKFVRHISPRLNEKTGRFDKKLIFPQVTQPEAKK